MDLNELFYHHQIALAHVDASSGPAQAAHRLTASDYAGRITESLGRRGLHYPLWTAA